MTSSFQKIKKLGALFALLFILVSAISPVVSYAAIVDVSKNEPANYTLLEPLPCVEGNGSGCKTGTQVTTVDFKNYVQYMFNLVIALAAVAAVFMIVWGGFQYMTSESINKKGDGLKTVQNAVYGLLLVLSSFLILRTIDPRLVEIPTTLVKPLEIKVDTNLTGSFFNNVVDSIFEQYKEQTTVLRQTNNVLNAQVDGLKKEEQDLVSQIGATIGLPNASEAVILQACGGGSISGSSPSTGHVEGLCSQLNQKISARNAVEGQIAINKAKGLMNITMSNCSDIGGGSNPLYLDDCLKQIEDNRARFMTEVRTTGRYDLLKDLNSYTEYSKAMVTIYDSMQRNLNQSPYTTAVIETTEQYIRDSAAVGGTFIGGAGTLGTGAVVGGGVGFIVGGAISNATVGALVAAENQNNRNQTISDIQTKINEVVSKNLIKDPTTLAQFKQVSSTLIQTLGGKGDGTDKIIQKKSGADSPVDYGGSFY